MKSFPSRLAGFLAFAPTTSFADVDFYSYGGFEVTVTGLNYIRSVFSDATYAILVLSVFSLAVMVSALVGTTRGIMGKQKGNDVLSSLFICVLGFTFYQATIIPTTTVHAYDTVLNKYQSVGNIPVFVAYTLGTINTLERLATDSFSTDTLNREEHGAGSTLLLLNKVLLSNPIKKNANLTRSIDQYIADCVPPAMASNVDTYGSFSMEKIITGTTSIVAEMVLTASHFQTTTYYDEANKNGLPSTCSDAWNTIAALLALPATFDDNYSAVCEQSGWRNLTASGFVDCKARISAISEVLLDGAANTIDTDTTAIAANQVLARAFGTMLTEHPTTYMQDMINMKNQVAGFSSLVASENWLPATRYTSMMIIIGFLPVLALMIVTPFFGKALKYMTGLVLFITVWSIGDASIHSITLDLVTDQLYSSRQAQYSVYTFFTAPTQLQEAIATLGRMQSMGLIFATIIMGTFFGISGHAFSNMGEKLASDIDRVGRDVGEETFDPSSRVSRVDGYSDATKKSGLMSEWGTENYMRNRGASSTERDYGNHEYFSQMSDVTPNEAMSYRAQIDGGQSAGKVRQTMDIAGSRGGDLSETSLDIGRMQTLNQYQDTVGTHTGRQQVEDIYGYNPETVIAKGVQNQSESTWGIRSGRDQVEDQYGLQAPSVIATSEENQAEHTLGTRAGRDILTATEGVNPIDLVKMDTINQGQEGISTSQARSEFMSENQNSLPSSTQSITDVLTQNKEAQIAQSTADANRLHWIQQNTAADDPLDAANKQARSNIHVAMSSEDLEKLQDQGGNVKDESIYQSQMNGGVAATLSLDENGLPFNVETLAASTATANDRTNIQTGVEIPNGGIYDMLDNNAAQGITIYSAALSGDDKATEQSVNRAWVDTTYGSMSASDSDKTTEGVSSNISGSIKPLSLLKVASPALADLIKVQAQADISASNTETDSREISTLGYFSYITDHYQGLYDKANDRNEELAIMSEYLLMQQNLSDTINAYASGLVEENIDDVTLQNGNSIKEESNRWTEARDQVENTLEEIFNSPFGGTILRNEDGDVVGSIPKEEEEEDYGKKIPLQ